MGRPKDVQQVSGNELDAHRQETGSRDLVATLYTAEQAAELLQVSPWWLRKKATARQVPCTFIGRYLRFSAADLDRIVEAGARPALSHNNDSSRNRPA